MVEDLNRLASELRGSGFSASVVADHSVDVKRLREELDLTQEQFALQFGLDVDAVRNWGTRTPRA